MKKRVALVRLNCIGNSVFRGVVQRSDFSTTSIPETKKVSSLYNSLFSLHIYNQSLQNICQLICHLTKSQTHWERGIYWQFFFVTTN